MIDHPENWRDFERSMAQMGRAYKIIGLSILIGILMILLAVAASIAAHAQETHDQMAQRHGGEDPYALWDYRLPNKPQTSCCNGRDCRPVRSRWNSDAMEFELQYAPNKWVPVDRSKVVKQPSFDENWHWCAPAARPYAPWCLIEPANGV